MAQEQIEQMRTTLFFRGLLLRGSAGQRLLQRAM